MFVDGDNNCTSVCSYPLGSCEFEYCVSYFVHQVILLEDTYVNNSDCSYEPVNVSCAPYIPAAVETIVKSLSLSLGVNSGSKNPDQLGSATPLYCIFSKESHPLSCTIEDH